MSWRSLSCDGEGRSGVGVVGSVSIERGRDLLSFRAVRRRGILGVWDAVVFFAFLLVSTYSWNG